MKHKRLKTLVLLLGAGLLGIHAQNMYVKESIGTTTIYSLSNIQKMYFSSGNVNIVKTDGSDKAYLLKHLQYLSFKEFTQEPDFSIMASPDELSLPQGNTLASTITITAIDGFNDDVSFTTSGLPTGVTANYDPETITGSGSTTLSLTATGDATLGLATLTVTATAGEISNNTAIELTITDQTEPDFSLSANPVKLELNAGKSAETQVIINALNGFDGTVNLDATGLPVGVTASFDPASVTGAGSSTLTLTANSDISFEETNITVTGTAGALSHEVGMTLTMKETVGIANHDQQGLRFYPNPVEDVLQVDLSNIDFREGTISIMNLEGKVLKRLQFINSNIISINVGHLPKGFYLCRFTNIEETKTIKFIKQ